MNDTRPVWTVIDRERAVLTLEYEFAKGGTANTFGARMSNGKMLIVSPCVGLSDAICAELLDYGDVGAIVANNGFHYMGLNEWRTQFPNARCFAPADAIQRIAKKQPEADVLEPLNGLGDLAGQHIGMREVTNTKVGESWYWVRTSGGYIWYVSDVLINLPALPGALMPRILFKLSKSAPGYRVFNLMLKMSVRDKKATLRQLANDMTEHEPTTIVPAHGTVLSHEAVASETRALLENVL